MDGAHPSARFADALDPFRFFEGPTLGAGVLRALGDPRVRRLTVATEGRAQGGSERLLHFDETYRYEDGEEDLWRWAVFEGEAGLEAAEASVVGAVRSRLSGPAWRLRFRRRARPPAEGPLLAFEARFDLVTPSVVFKTVRVRLHGVPIARVSLYHERAPARTARA